MEYGYFDDAKREYVIHNPNTPEPWINYLGTDQYCSMISNNAGGYAFYKTAWTGRVLRFRHNNIPEDRPGRYMYIRDNASGDYWSSAWQPVAKPLDEYKTICRHGMGYTTFESEYGGIKSNSRYFVPIDKPIEFWEIELENTSGRERDLSLFSYAEMSYWLMTHDTIGFQYSLHVCNNSYEDGIISNAPLLWPPYEPRSFFLSILPVESFDTERKSFIGRWRHEGNPIAVEKGKCNNSIAIGGNPIGAFQNNIKLAPGEKKRALFILGAGEAGVLGVECKKLYSVPGSVEKEFEKVREYWDERLGAFSCVTPSDKMNSMINVWNQYQCHTTFNWSRSASYIEVGHRDGLGYRDTNQDVLGVAHVLPSQVKAKLRDLLMGQVSNGSAIHTIQPLDWKQSEDNVPEHPYSDDHLWLHLAVESYIKETGDIAFLDEIYPYADKGEASVYEHLRAALEFSNSKRGEHGLLMGMAADWNDCINLKGKGESMFSTFLYYLSLEKMIDFANIKGKDDDARHFADMREDMRAAIEKHAWDGEWYLRGFLRNGDKLGSHESEQCHIFINSQTWSVLSKFAPKDKGIACMDSLNKYMATEHGIVKNYPAFRKLNEEIGAITSFPAGKKENASIFCHTNTWAVIAEAMLGRGDRAFEYYMAYLPAAKNETADKYEIEPYVYCQFITGKEHPYDFGQARNSWLSGTASWSFVAASQYILGVRADYDGLIIDPCIPADWKEYTVKRKFRGLNFDITVKNPEGKNRGVTQLLLNGEQLDGNKIPLDKAKDNNTVTVVL